MEQGLSSKQPQLRDWLSIVLLVGDCFCIAFFFSSFPLLLNCPYLDP